MIKFSQLLKEQEDNNKPLNSSERKVISMLLKKFFLEDEDYEMDIMIFEKIFNFLIGPIGFSPEQALNIYNLLYLNSEEIKSGETDWMDNPIRKINVEDYKGEVMALAEFLQLPPYIIEHDDYEYYGLDNLIDPVTGAQYVVGDEDDVNRAAVEMAENLTYGLQDNSPMTEFLDSELHSMWGDDILIKHMYISKNDIHHIASDDARRVVEDDYYDDEEILKMTERIVPSIGDEWERLQGLIEDLYDQGFPQSENEEQQEIYEDKIKGYEKEISDLAERSKDVLFDHEYDVVTDRLSNDLLDYLWEMDYIDKGGNGKWSFVGDTGWHNREKFRFPDYVRVSIDDIDKETIEYHKKYRAEEIGRYNHQENIEEYNGVEYYIYRID